MQFVSASECFPFYPDICLHRKRHPLRGQGPNCSGFLRYNYISEGNGARIGTQATEKPLSNPAIRGWEQRSERPRPWGGNSSAWFPGLAAPQRMRSEGCRQQGPSGEVLPRRTGHGVLGGSLEQTGEGASGSGRGSRDERPHWLEAKGSVTAGPQVHHCA